MAAETASSLSSFLLGEATSSKKKKASKMTGLDSSLDAIFRSSALAAPKPVDPVPSGSSGSKRKADIDIGDSQNSASSGVKRRKSVTFGDTPKKPDHSAKRIVAESSTKKASKTEKAKAKAPQKQEEDNEEEGSDEELDDANLEDAYLMKNMARTLPRAPSKHSKPKPDSAASESGTDDEPTLGNEDESDDSEFSPLVHESIAPQKRDRSSKKKTKYIPEGETKEDRDARTIFIGNISVEVAKSKPSLKQFKRHFTSTVPGSKVESVRFRSIAFKNPTSEMPDSDDEVPKKGAKAGELSAKQQRQQERATKWRDNSSTGEAAKEGDASAKVYLKPSEKKKVAYIKGEFHDTVDTVNCYLVFAHHDPSRAQGDQLSPSEAARLAVEKCDGTVLLGRTIRVDRVGSAEKGRKEGRSDPKFTIFVGNLDFSSKEEDVRAFFEGVVTTERGPVSEGDDEVTGKPKTWVRHVRIVRDANTQLGKGFAYVEFADRESVDEVLALEQDKLKFAKRKLRVQRCKTLNKPTTQPNPKPKQSPSASKPYIPPAVVPKGDPSLGDRLRGLDKESRRAIKTADADRVARRVAKKKAKHTMEKDIAKLEGSIKERPRKKSGAGGKLKPKTKTRMRSDKSLAKKNVKK